MPQFTPPTGFVQQLQAFDPLLRVRWSDWERRWRIERKITHARSIDPGRFLATDYEQFVARQAGYLPILFCRKEQLDNRVFALLYAADMHRHGGAQKVADELERMEAEGRQRSRARWLDDVWAGAVDFYKYINTISPTQRKLRSRELD